MEFIKTLQDTVNEINLKGIFRIQGMNIHDGGLRALSSYVLSNNERKNKNLNFIGGFEIMDNDFRVFVLEGISHLGIRDLEAKTTIKDPNT